MGSTVPQQQTEATKMAAANDAIVVTCTNNSDYAVICSFFEQFGDKSGLLCPSFQDLQEMLENVEEVSYTLIELHVKLMRKLKKSVSFDRWEKAAAKYAHSYSDQDGWAIERFGYKKLNLDVKLRLLKNLLEAQFDGNVKFKNEINKVTSEELRLQPLGKDLQGRRYWHLLDDDCNLRVYREDLDEETWDLVSSDKESMLKLIELLSSCKDLQEDGGTSPATSEENSAHGQEEDSKVEIVAQVQQPHESPLEAKRLKLECVEVPATPGSHPESIISEAIESPILVVKGEGNGADCDTGNPGEGKSEESCESRSSNSEQAKMENTSAVICESDVLKPCADKSEPLAILQPQTESLSAAPSSACQSNTLNLVPNDLVEAPLVKLDNETSVEANNATKPIVSENCSENPSALNSSDKEISGSSNNSTELDIALQLSGDANSSNELTREEGSPVSLPLEGFKPTSIGQPPVEVDGFNNQQGCPEPLKDNGIAEVSRNDDNRFLKVDASDHPAVLKETSISETSIQLSRNQELPKCDGSSAVSLDPIHPKSPAASESADISDDTISCDLSSRSTCDIVTETLVTPTKCLPSVTDELEEEKKIVKPVLMPGCPPLEQKDSPEIEESRPEQTIELKHEFLDNRDPALIPNTNTAESESQPPIQSRSESPVKSVVHNDNVMTEIDAAISHENIVPKVHEVSDFCDVPVVSKASDVEQIEAVGISAASEIHTAKPCLPGSVSVSEKGEAVAVIDLLKEGGPPSLSFNLPDTSQCSESDPVADDNNKPMFQEEKISLSPAYESEVTEEVQVLHSGLNDLPVSDVNGSTSALPTADTESLPVTGVEEDPETRTCSDSVNQCVVEESVVGVVETTPKPAPEEVDYSPISNSLVKEVALENPQNEEKLANTKVLVSMVQDQLHAIDEEPATNLIENVADKEKPADLEEHTGKAELAHKEELADKEAFADKEEFADEEQHAEKDELTEKEELAEKEKCAGKEDFVDEEKLTVREELTDKKEFVDEEQLVVKEKLADEGRLSSKEELTGKKALTGKDGLTDKEELVDKEKLTDKEVLEDKEVFAETESLESSKEQAVTDPPSLAKDDCIVLDVSAKNESTCIPDTLDEKTPLDESKATAEISSTSAEKNSLSYEKADDACSIPVLPENNVVNEMQPEEMLKLEEEEKISSAFTKDEIPPAERELESTTISQELESKHADEPKAEEDTLATALAKTQPEPEATDEPDRSLDDPVKNESIVAETAEVLKEETEQKVNTPAHEDESISAVAEPGRSPDDPVKEELIGAETTEVSKEETVQKVDSPARLDEQESISVKLAVEVPYNTLSEFIQKNELAEGPDDSCSISVEPVPELKYEVPAVVIKHESVSVQQKLESNLVPVISNNSELKQTEPKEVFTYKRPEIEEILPVVVPLDVKNEVLSVSTSEVITEKEPSVEEPKASVQESVSLEEKDRISSFEQEHLVSKVQLSTELVTDDSTVISSQSEIPLLLVKEESPPVVPDKIVPNSIPDGCGRKPPDTVPVKTETAEQALADELKTIPGLASPEGNEDTPQTHASLITQKIEKEASPISEVVQSETSDTLPEVPVSPETPQNVEENITNQPSAEISSNLNQLTFDFDASAPVTIVLPPSKKPDTSAKRRGRKRSRVGHDVSADSGKENDAQPTVLRQSSRIAKLREKEDEDRRKEEADRLQRLKEEHERREKRRTARDEKMKKMEEKQQRRQLKTTIREDVTYKSEEESSSSDEEKNSEEEGRNKKGKKDKRRHRKKTIDRPWDSTDSSEKSSESDVDGLDDLVVEEEPEELVFKSDHEFSPESDLDDEAETVQPTKHARTARAGVVPKKRGRSKKVKIEEEVEEEEALATEEEEEEEEAAKCHKCGQSDHPEWILLCDRCDGGWHANCVKPPLLVIPEGHWFCPPCDHATLLERLQERLETYEFLLQEKEAELKRRKEQEMEAKLAKEEAEKQALLEAEEEAQEDDEEDEKNSGAGDLGADGEDEETSEDSGEDEDEEDEDAENNESDENLNGRRQRKAAKQANYSFKDFDDMIKSALRDEADEEEEETGGKGKGKGLRSGVEGNSEDDEDKPRSPQGSRPSGIGNKRISTSDDDSDIMPQVMRKKKARKLNDLSATSNEDDSDEDFAGSSAEGSDSEDDEEDASDSGDSFVVDDDSDDDDVVHVRSKKKTRVASPTIRRSARSSRKRNLRMDSSDTSEEESEYEEKPTKRKKGNESWDSSGASSSDASWGRSKKRSATKSRPKPIATPKPKPKPPPRKSPANRGRGRGGRSSKVESDDEPFRSNVSVKKIKEARPVKAEEEEDSDHAQKRTTRGRQISYKELISSGESQDENGSTAKKMGTLFAADRIKNMPGAAIRGGSSRRGGRGGVVTQSAGRANVSGGDNTPVPVSVISSRIGAALSQDDESRLSGSTDTIEFSSAVAAATAAASAYTTGDESHTSNEILTPSIEPDLSNLPLVLPHEEEAIPLIKDELPAIVPVPVLSQDLQVSRLIQQRPVEVPPTLPPDLQINRLINSHTISSSSNSPARQSPGIPPQQRLLRDVLDSQTPPPAIQLSPIILTQPPVIAPTVELPPYSHSGVIKQTRHSLPPTPPLYSSPHVVKTSDLIASSTLASVIRPYPTTATASPLSPSISGSSTLGNPLSIQGLLGTGHGSPGSTPSAPPPSHPSGHIRPYGNTPHMIGHGPFLNHTPYANPYSAAPPSRTSYMGTPVTPTPRQAYPPMYSSPHLPPHGLPLHSPYQHHGPPLRPTSSYQHAGFPQAFAAAAAAAASAEEERRIYRVAAQASRESAADNYEPGTSSGLLLKGGAEDPTPATAVPPESEFGGLVSYFSSQQEDFEES